MEFAPYEVFWEILDGSNDSRGSPADGEEEPENSIAAKTPIAVNKNKIDTLSAAVTIFEVFLFWKEYTNIIHDWLLQKHYSEIRLIFQTSARMRYYVQTDRCVYLSTYRLYMPM